MEWFRLLFDHLALIEHQFLSDLRDSSKAGSLWGMMRGGGGVRKSIDQSWLAKGLGLGLLCWGFKGVHEEIPSESIFRVLLLCFFDRMFSTRFRQRPLAPPSDTDILSALTPSAWPTQTIWPVCLWVHVYIFFHKHYTFTLSFELSTHVTCFAAFFLFTQLEHPVLENPNWRVCQRSICKNRKNV